MKDALAATMTTLPAQLCRSLTWDRGKELSAHVAFKDETGISVYFADPHSPWQRGTNENTNGLLRQCPEGHRPLRWTTEEIEAVATTINSRPRKTLGWRTPAEALDEHLRSPNKPVLRPPIEPTLGARSEWWTSPVRSSWRRPRDQSGRVWSSLSRTGCGDADSSLVIPARAVT